MIKLSHWCCSTSCHAAAAAAAMADNNAELSSDQLGVEFWKTKYGQLEEHCKVTNEQKVIVITQYILTRTCTVEQFVS